MNEIVKLLDLRFEIQTQEKVQHNTVWSTKHNLRIFGAIPFIKLQNNT